MFGNLSRVDIETIRFEFEQGPRYILFPDICQIERNATLKKSVNRANNQKGNVSGMAFKPQGDSGEPSRMSILTSLSEKCKICFPSSSSQRKRKFHVIENI